MSAESSAATLPAPTSLETHARLVAALSAYLERSGARVRLVQTHISSVLIASERAYKVKKPVALPFLDFSTLEARKHYCEEELRLNRRLAPSLYLAVVPITGSIDAPTLYGPGPVLDYAVAMRAFDEKDLASEALARGAFTAAHTDALAAAVARFHASAPRAGPSARYGTPELVLAPALANCTEILAPAEAVLDRSEVRAIAAWTRREHAAIATMLQRRHDEGYVRECHGDLHLRNVALIDGDPTLFDGIEFNEALRWIDVISDVAFLVMDFHDRGRSDLAHRVLNAYLEHTGDYGGLAVLRFYLVYRAMVRVKVAALRARQLGAGAEFAQAAREAAEYLAVAQRFMNHRRPALMITHGFAGSGKSTATQALIELTGAVRIRTDVERKRLRGLAPHAPSDSPVGGGLYTEDATRRTYAASLAHARAVLAAGYLAIVDGTFLRRWQRDLARDLARASNVPFVVVAVTASLPSLRQRVLARSIAGRDASEATVDVLERQIAIAEPFGADERSDVVSYDSERSDPRSTATWTAALSRLARPTAPASMDEKRALEERIAFLAQPASYREPTPHVSAIETHWSWVFLTDHFAYKLKKPVRSALNDLSTVAGRRRNSEEELRLNRRLAPEVYLGLEAIWRGADGRLAFGQGEEIVDWIVRMRRLPPDAMLDHVLRQGALSPRHVRGLTGLLCRFYARQCPVSFSREVYVARFAQAIDDNLSELSGSPLRLPAPLLERVHARQRLALLRLTPELARRARENRIREGHGDLRPEHVCLEPEPVVIDCLEFSRELRLLDPADELAFLALECERLGDAAAGSAFLSAYRSIARDDVEQRLVHWYASFRAITRARLAASHLREVVVRPGDWLRHSVDYLRLAERHLDQCW